MWRLGPIRRGDIGHSRDTKFVSQKIGKYLDFLDKPALISSLWLGKNENEIFGGNTITKSFALTLQGGGFVY